MQDEITEEMGSWLSTLINDSLKKKYDSYSKTSSEEQAGGQLKDMLMLSLILFNTKMFNSYILMASWNTKNSDNKILKLFKSFANELKDLSYITHRFIHVDGMMSSREIMYSEKKELSELRDKIKSFKDEWESNVFASFTHLTKMICQNLEDKFEKHIEFLPFALRYIINLYHGQNIKEVVYDMAEAQNQSKWVSPYSEISKMLQISLIVEFRTSKGYDMQTAMFDFPFVFHIDGMELRFDSFKVFLKNEFRKQVQHFLVESGIKESDIFDLEMWIVNQPELFIASIGPNIDKKSFYSILENGEIVYDTLFKFPKDATFTKKLLFKHIVFWNLEYKIYEKFTLQTFKYIDHGVEKMNAMWIGEYDKEPQQIDYSEFFEALERCHLTPVLIIWEKLQALEVTVKQDTFTGFQTIERGRKITTSRKYAAVDDEGQLTLIFGKSIGYLLYVYFIGCLLINFFRSWERWRNGISQTTAREIWQRRLCWTQSSKNS